MIGVLVRREETKRAREKPCEDGGRSCRNTSTCHGTPRIANNHQKLGRDEEGVFPRALRGGHGPAKTSISDLEPPEL